MKRLPWTRRFCLARRSMALFVLVTFAAGNIGWPIPAGSGKCRSVAGKSMCCCGDRSKVGNCGCCKNRETACRSDAAPDSASSKLPSCCQKKKQKAAAPRELAVKCACGDSPLPGFLMSSQPKLQSVPPQVAELVQTAFLAAPASNGAPQGNLAPETPPPRPSVS